MTERTPHGQLLREHRDEKMSEFFEGKRFRIVKEFNLPEGEQAVTPFGYKLRHGFVLREVGNPDNQFVVGYRVLKAAEREFGAVTIPPKRRGRPPRDAAPEPLRVSDLLFA